MYEIRISTFQPHDNYVCIWQQNVHTSAKEHEF